MTISPFSITAPALGLPGHSEAEVFGSLAWLCMHSEKHRYLPLIALSQSLLAPMKARQCILASAPDGDTVRPVAYLVWANFSAEAESRYLAGGASALLRPEDWNSGDRMWIIDWIAPFGHSAQLRREVVARLSECCFRWLDRRSGERGLRVKTMRGCRVSQAQASAWWSARPMTAPAVASPI